MNRREALLGSAATLASSLGLNLEAARDLKTKDLLVFNYQGVLSKAGAENIKKNISKWVEINNIESPWILLDNTIKLEILKNESVGEKI